MKKHCKPYEEVRFNHADVVNGGSIVLEVGSVPNRKFGAADSLKPRQVAAVPTPFTL